MWQLTKENAIKKAELPFTEQIFTETSRLIGVPVF